MNAAESEREQIGFKRPSFINVVPTAEVFRGVQLMSENLEIHHLHQPFQRVARLRQRRIPLVEFEKSGLALHRKTPRKSPREVNHDPAKSGRFLEAPICDSS